MEIKPIVKTGTNDLNNETVPAKPKGTKVRIGRVGRPKKPKGRGRPPTRYRAYSHAKQYVHRQKLTSEKEWYQFTRSGKLPEDIPIRPHLSYPPTQWKGWKDWLGYGFMSYADAKELIRPLGIQSVREYRREWADLFTRPYMIPAYPERHYKEWKGWSDFFSRTRMRHKDHKMNPNSLKHLVPYRKGTHYRPFMEAVKFVSTLGLRDHVEWLKWRSKYPHDDLPWRPDEVYDKDWSGWSIFLGHDAIPGLLENVAVLFVGKHSDDPENVYRVQIHHMGKSDLMHRAVREQFRIIRMWKYDPMLREQVREVLRINTSAYYGSDQIFIVPNIFGLYGDLFGLLPVIV